MARVSGRRPLARGAPAAGRGDPARSSSGGLVTPSSRPTRATSTSPRNRHSTAPAAARARNHQAAPSPQRAERRSRWRRGPGSPRPPRTRSPPGPGPAARGGRGAVAVPPPVCPPACPPRAHHGRPPATGVARPAGPPARVGPRVRAGGQGGGVQVLPDIVAPRPRIVFCGLAGAASTRSATTTTRPRATASGSRCTSRALAAAAAARGGPPRRRARAGPDRPRRAPGPALGRGRRAGRQGGAVAPGLAGLHLQGRRPGGGSRAGRAPAAHARAPPTSTSPRRRCSCCRASAAPTGARTTTAGPPASPGGATWPRSPARPDPQPLTARHGHVRLRAPGLDRPARALTCGFARRRGNVSTNVPQQVAHLVSSAYGSHNI